MQAELVVRADDAGVAERGGADAGAVSRRRRLRSSWLEELRAAWLEEPAVGREATDWCRGYEHLIHAKSLAPLFLLASYKKFRACLLKVVSL